VRRKNPSRLAKVSSATGPASPGKPGANHTVHFYGEDRSLFETLNSFIGAALANGEAAVVVATRSHRTALERALQSRGVDLPKATSEGRYVALDASEVLSKIMAGGRPDPHRFSAFMGAVLKKARAAAESRRIAVFGEMVAALWKEGRHEAAIRLEVLWNQLAETHSFSLLCGYPLSAFSKTERRKSFAQICAEHSAVIDADASMRLLTDDQALEEIVAPDRKDAFGSKEAVNETRQQLHLLVEAVQDYAIFLLDAEGCVRTWNTGAERIKGYKASEIIGRHFSCFYPEADIAARKPQRELEIARSEGRVEDEGWRLRRDGSRFWANVIITALKSPAGEIIGFAKVTRDFTDRLLARQALEESQRRLEDSEKSLRELSLHLLRTQDEERRRIGRDLHDSLGQYLSVLKMKLESLIPREPRPTDTMDLKDCAQLTEQALKEVRTISYLLYPPMLEDLGLKSAMPWYVDGFTKRSGIKITFDLSPGFRRLSNDIELALFRILQESLTNVHRHSGSSTAEVRLSTIAGGVVLEVRDHGKGMPAQDGQVPPGSLGVGLRGMNERIRQLGGTLEVSSTSRGTIVTATVPVASTGTPPLGLDFSAELKGRESAALPAPVETVSDGTQNSDRR
jgi:PAS domain S-box-containing protein